MELREEQVQAIKKNEAEEEKQVLSALAILGEIIVAQCQTKRK